jgi:hypothetical protein
MHVSQLEYHRNVYGKGEFSSEEFGLAFSAVGADAAKNDFFEHIDPARLSDYTAPVPIPAATPVLVETPKKEQPVELAAESGESMQNSSSLLWISGISGFVAAFAAALAVVLIRKTKKRK